MKITRKKVNGFSVIALEGDFLAEPDHTDFREHVRTVMEEGGRHLVVDLSGVRHINSCGLGSLVCAMVMTKKNSGDIRYVGVNRDVGKLLEMTHLHRVFQIFPGIKEATTGKFSYQN